MKFGIVETALERVIIGDFSDMTSAMSRVRLFADHVDHAVVGPTTGIVVNEFGLFKKPAAANYFGIDGRLYEGDAVLYSFNEVGQTVDFPCDPTPPSVTFYRGVDDVEKAIAGGHVQRPQMSVNGQVLWRWPHPPLPGMMS